MTKAYKPFLVGIARTDNQPLLKNERFDSIEAAENYAKNDPTAYVGQLISVFDGTGLTIFTIRPGLSIRKIAEGDSAITMAFSSMDEANEFIKDHDVDVGQVFLIVDNESSAVETCVVSKNDDGTLYIRPCVVTGADPVWKTL